MEQWIFPGQTLVAILKATKAMKLIWKSSQLKQAQKPKIFQDQEEFQIERKTLPALIYS